VSALLSGGSPHGTNRYDRQAKSKDRSHSGNSRHVSMSNQVDLKSKFMHNSSSMHELDKQRRTRGARKAEMSSKHNMSSSTVYLQQECSIERRMQDEEALALKQAQEYTYRFFEGKSSPEKRKNNSP